MAYQTGVFVSVDSSDAERGLNGLRERLNDLIPPTAEAALLWSEYIDHLFETTPWPELAETTIIRKISGGYPLDMLVREGVLKDRTTGGQWQISQGAGSAHARLRAPRYGHFHATGTRFMPARDWSMLDAPTVEKMVEVFVKYVEEGWSGGFSPSGSVVGA